MSKSRMFIAASRTLAVSLLLCVGLASGLAAADAGATKLSPQESGFIQQNMNDSERAEFMKLLMAEPPADPAAMETRTNAVLLVIKAKLAARGVTYGAPAVPAGFPGGQPAAGQPTSSPSAADQRKADITFLQANLSPAEISQLSQQLMVVRGDEAATAQIIKTALMRLAAKGITPASAKTVAAMPKRPTIDLAKYTVAAMPKQADWIASEPGDQQGKGFYRETSVNATVQRVQVGVWESDPDQGDFKRGARNADGKKVGPQWTFYAEGQLGSKVKLIEVLAADGSKTTETLRFHKDGGLAEWKKFHEDGSVEMQAYYPTGHMSADCTERPNGEQSMKSYHQNGQIQQSVATVLTSSTAANAPKTVRITKEFAENGDMKSVMIGLVGSPISLQPRDETVPAGARQQIVWNDEAYEDRGIQAAGFVTGDGAGVRVGPWVTWTATGAPASGGSYENGKKEGTWTEIEFGTVNGASVAIAQNTGRYAADQKTGIWTTIYGNDHPLVVSAMEKRRAAAGGGPSVSINEREGYKATTTYTNGQAGEVQRNFTP